MEPKEIEAKHIITKSKLPGLSYCINPYIGCLHACVYCYAGFMRRFTNHCNDKWGSFVDVKMNAAKLFSDDFAHLKPNDSLFFGSVTDVYQPAESRYQLTRSLLKQIIQKQKSALFSEPIEMSILTKSDLVLRDIDLLLQIPSCSVGFSIALMDEKARRIFEPCASPVKQRLAALRELHQAGIQTFVFLGPILPFITPINAIFQEIDGSVNSIFGETLNMRCGNLSQIYSAVLQYDRRLLNSFQQAIQNIEFWMSVESLFRAQADQYHITVEGFYCHLETK